jgi:lysophospholipase L1-like esterase
MGRRREAIGNAGLLAAGTAAALLLAEAAVRLLGLAPEVAFIQRGRFRLSTNPAIGYEPVPGLERPEGDLGFWDWRSRSNSLGFRDREHPVARTPGVTRILVLGDSVAAGLRIPDDGDVFPPRLERILNERGRRAEVLNFAVSGYNTQQEVEILKDRGLRFDPDLVILAYCLNDNESRENDILRALLAERRGARFIDPDRLSPLLVRSALYRLVRHRLEPADGDDDAYARLRRDRVEEYFHELGRLSRAKGFRVVVAVFPLFAGVGDYANLEYHATLRSIAADAGLEFLDLLPAFRSCEAAAGAGPIALDPLHPSAEGHRCAAAALADYLLASDPPR